MSARPWRKRRNMTPRRKAKWTAVPRKRHEAFHRSMRRMVAAGIEMARANYDLSETLAARNVAAANLRGVTPEQVDQVARLLFERDA